MSLPARPPTAADDPARELAATILGRLFDGESLDLQALTGQLPDDEARDRCLRFVHEARRVQELLPQPLRPGLELGGRYRVGRELGAGGMGRVFEAEDLKLHRTVAVKVLTTLGGQSLDAERQFLNEAMLLARLKHPNIVAVHEFGVHDGQPYLVMELVDGTTLSDVLDRVRALLHESGAERPRSGALLRQAIGRPLPAGRKPPPAGDDWFRAAARLTLEIARTLEAAHGSETLHRDLKPQNVMLRGDGSPVVLDFGLAGTIDRVAGGVTRSLFGTGAYLAPEQVATGCMGSDPRTDVYQVGLLLYELLVLRRAYPGQEIASLLRRVGHGDFVWPRAIDRGVPAELQAVCLTAMELNTDRRYASMRELREDLQRWVEDGLPPRAARGGLLASGLRHSRSFARRHRVALAAGGTAALAALVWFATRQPAGPWIGDVVAFRKPSGSSVPQYAPEFSSIEPGDLLGVQLHGRTPAHVYALSVFGFGEAHQFVAPMVVKAASDVEAGAASAAPASWDRLVQPGESVACTHVGVAAPDGQHEGLLLFASAVPQQRLSRWMDELQDKAKDAPNHAVSWADAKAAFDASTGTTRGEQVHLSAEEAAAIERFSADAVLGDTTWSLPDPRRWEFSFVVRR